MDCSCFLNLIVCVYVHGLLQMQHRRCVLFVCCVDLYICTHLSVT